MGWRAGVLTHGGSRARTITLATRGRAALTVEALAVAARHAAGPRTGADSRARRGEARGGRSRRGGSGRGRPLRDREPGAGRRGTRRRYGDSRAHRGLAAGLDASSGLDGPGRRLAARARAARRRDQPPRAAVADAPPRGFEATLLLWVTDGDPSGEASRRVSPEPSRGSMVGREWRPNPRTGRTEEATRSQAPRVAPHAPEPRDLAKPLRVDARDTPREGFRAARGSRDKRGRRTSAGAAPGDERKREELAFVPRGSDNHGRRASRRTRPPRDTVVPAEELVSSSRRSATCEPTCRGVSERSAHGGDGAAEGAVAWPSGARALPDAGRDWSTRARRRGWATSRGGRRPVARRPVDRSAVRVARARADVHDGGDLPAPSCCEGETTDP